MTPCEYKKHIRQVMLARLQGIAANAREEYSTQLRGLLSPLLQGGEKTVALYYPLPHEVNLLPLLSEYPIHRYAFPRCLPGRRLQFHGISDPGTQMEPGMMGIPVPSPRCPLIPPEEFDIVIVPGLAFTRRGKRLGYGGGFYDRYLPRCQQATWLAVAFAEQMLPDIPTEEHDLTVPLILSL